MADQQTNQVLNAQLVPVIDCTSIMETVTEKVTAHHNAAIEKILKDINLQQNQINSQNKQMKDMTEMFLRLSNTLNQQKQPVNTGGYNVPVLQLVVMANGKLQLIIKDSVNSNLENVDQAYWLESANDYDKTIEFGPEILFSM